MSNSMNPQDSRSELDKIFDEHIKLAGFSRLYRGSDSNFDEESLKASIEAYVATRVKEAERLARINELKWVFGERRIWWQSETSLPMSINERVQALKTQHEWTANDTLSVFTCSKCGLRGFAPHPVQEYGCITLTATTNGKEE